MTDDWKDDVMSECYGPASDANPPRKDELTRLKELAEKAIEARKAYKLGHGKPDTEARLWADYVGARAEHDYAATPEWFRGGDTRRIA